MQKMTVAEAAAYYKISKEAIHNRIRRGSLKSIVENGIKLVLVEDALKKTVQKSERHVDQRYYDYIEEENARLRAKIEKLENETLTLREKREQMLIEERDKIERIYKERDEQLKTVLHVVASKFLTAQNIAQVVDEAIDESAMSEDAEVIESHDLNTLVTLKKFIKLKGFGKKRAKKIETKFKKRKKNDARIIVKNGKIYIDPNRYDYSDLLE